MFPAHIPLEDDACDVISKAMHGLEISPWQLSELTGLGVKIIRAALKGDHTDKILKKIAPALQLSAAALVGLAKYQPNATAPSGLIGFTSPFGHAGVNAYAIITGQRAIVFDTDTDASAIARFLAEKNLTLDTLYITHRHHDHTAGTPHFNSSCIIYPEDAPPGNCREVYPGHQLTILDVGGHTNPARAYFYEGLEVPVCIVGDSIFAGSMGRAPHSASYQQALQTAADNVLTLPPNTILCPGHGPLTTVADEKINNPFLAGA